MARTIRFTSLALVASVLALAAGHADDKATPQKGDKKGEPAKLTVMQRKLQQAQRLLEGLALNDFGKIDKATSELIQLRTEAGWAVLKTPRYTMLSDDFLRHLEAAKKASKAKNLDAAALAYVEITLTCVKCHQHMRDEGIGQALPVIGVPVRAAAP